MSPLFDRIQVVRDRFPADSRSATIPALRLAQEEYGWLPPEALCEVADALELTPAYCHAVASRATKDGARNLTRQGFGPPSETT